MRRLVILLVVTLVLIASRQAILNWRPVLSGEPGTLLYAATFDAFNDEWQQYRGILEAQIVDGVLRIAADDVDRLPYSVARPYFADFDLRIEARAVEGPLNNGYGVVFHAQNPDNLYWFLISSDGYYSVHRKVAGAVKKLSDWISTPLINQGLGVVNRLRVVADNGQFRFFINGQQVQLCAPDNPEGVSTYSQGECQQGKMVDALAGDALNVGQVGPAVLTLNESGVVVEFDNVVIVAPQPLEEAGS